MAEMIKGNLPCNKYITLAMLKKEIDACMVNMHVPRPRLLPRMSNMWLTVWRHHMYSRVITSTICRI